MGEKRRDSRNRILRDGESQRKDGRYRYRYQDAGGKTTDIYSWRLTPSDKTPPGRKEGPSLREQIEEIERERRLCQDAVPSMSVADLVARYVRTKTGVTHNTEAGYKTVTRKLDKDPFGSRGIEGVKVSDAKLWLIHLQKDEGLGHSSICSIRGVVRPAFQMAVDDDILPRNPFDFPLSTVIVNDSVAREAITEEQEEELLEFVRGDISFSQCYDGILLLFETGVRVSELAGLTVADLDMGRRQIRVERQLQRMRDGVYAVMPTKTGAGVRTLPMSGKAYRCCQRILEGRRHPEREPVIGGCSGFLFYDEYGRPATALYWERCFQRICRKYDMTHEAPMPHITPHVCRHTYCSNMARRGMNPKVLQYLMGHSNVSVTMNTYTHLRLEDAKREMERIGEIT